jgi:hypothetical protein
LLEDVADARPYTTWKAAVDERLKALGTEVWYGGSDRANAPIQLAEQGLACLSMPDVFPLMHDIVQSSSLALARQVRPAHKGLTHAEEVRARHLRRPPPEPDGPEANAQRERQRAEVQHWEEVQCPSRQHLETLSLTFHPFAIATALPQTSGQVESRVQAEVDAIEALAGRHQWPARPGAMPQVRTQLPALAALVDVWWQGVERDGEPFGLSSQWWPGVEECLLPMGYWDHQVARARCRRRKAKRQQAWQEARAACDRHAITQRLAPQVRADWHAWATDRVHALQRTASAVEGRHGSLSQRHPNHRGLPKRRYKVWTVLHTFDCRAADGTTPASRFFRRTFPDLFETVLSHIEVFPRARQRKHDGVLSG